MVATVRHPASLSRTAGPSFQLDAAAAPPSVRLGSRHPRHAPLSAVGGDKLVAGFVVVRDENLMAANVASHSAGSFPSMMRMVSERRTPIERK